jgi:hypothetical protein
LLLQRSQDRAGRADARLAKSFPGRLSIGDLTADGRPEVVIADVEQGLMVYRNDPG